MNYLRRSVGVVETVSHKTITQSDRLLVRSYGISSRLDHKTAEERSRHGPLYIHSGDNCRKGYDSKNCYAPNEHFNDQQIKFDEGTRKKLFDVDIIYLQDLEID